MNKITIGLLLGAVLGALDGATAWFTPEVRAGIVGIIIGSTIKGMIAGFAAGWFARKVQSTPAGIVFGAFQCHLLPFHLQAKYLKGGCLGLAAGTVTLEQAGHPGAGIPGLLLILQTVEFAENRPLLKLNFRLGQIGLGLLYL